MPPLPVTPAMLNRPLQAVVLGLNPGQTDLRPEAWITAYPTPLASRELILNLL